MNIVFENDHLCHEIFTNLNIRELCLIKATCKQFRKIADIVDEYKYRQSIYIPFLRLKENVYELILNNIIYLSMRENALIYFEFASTVLDKYEIVLHRDDLFVDSFFYFITLLYDFLPMEEEQNTYDIVLKNIRKYLFIKNHKKVHKNQLIKYVKFKYPNMTNEELIGMKRKALIKYVIKYS